MTTAVATVIRKSELAEARILMRSVAGAHPSWKPHVLLIDEVEGLFDPLLESFAVIEIRDLPLPDKRSTLFFYEAEELRAAVKPHLFAWLFETLGFDEVVYLDPRVWVQAPLTAVEEAFRTSAPLVVTPHLVASDDLDHPNEAEILTWGVLDSAFLAMSRRAPQAAELLLWWLKRSYRQFFVDPVLGPYGDQRWLDLAAGRWPVEVIRDPAYNVTRLTASGRDLHRVGSEYRVGDNPLRFFQFDGKDGREASTKGEPSQRDREHEGLELILADRRRALWLTDFGVGRSWPYAFDRFASGSRIHPLCRALYRSDGSLRRECGEDPFRTGPTPFNVSSGSSPYVTRVMQRIWDRRADLQRVFPDLGDAANARAFAEWFVGAGEREYDLDETYLNPVRTVLHERAHAPGAGAEQPEPAVQHAPESASTRSTPPSLLGERRLVRLALGGASALGRVIDATAKVGGWAARRAGNRWPALRSTPAPDPVAPSRTSVASATDASSARKAGMNIVGYVTADLGIGQSARSCATAAEAVGIDYCAVDFAMGTQSPKTDRTLATRITPRNVHPVNVVHVNADQMPYFRSAMGPDFFTGKYTIGYWHWELPELPEAYVAGFEGLDEVWVPTRFVQTAVSARAKVPVVLMPHAVSFAIPEPARERFGLPEDKFLFLTMYDLFSYQERKNPAASVAAFERAFGARRDVALVVKVINADRRPEDLKKLRERLDRLPGAVLIAETLAREDVYSLEASCDVFVSLHRSEGFGLGLAESMFLGKPVIGTNWSGNVDFMTHKNSCPVEYELISLDQDHGPYKRGQVWANPDVEHAARYMKQLADDRAFAGKVGARGRETMVTDNSPETIGKRYLERLRMLGFGG